MAAIPETPGQAPKARDEGAGTLSGRSGRRRRRRTLGRSSGHGVHQPSDVGSGRKPRDRSEESTRGRNPRHLPGPLAGGRPGVPGGHSKALESAVQDQGWQSARHLEIIPPQSASLCTVGERDQAAKQELRMLRLRGAMTKAKGSK